MKRFSELGAYLERLRIQTIGKTLVLDKRRIEPDVLDVMQIRSYRAVDRAGLQIADIVASAFYDAVNIGRNGLYNPDNAKLLMPRIAFDKTVKPRRFSEYGVVLQPTRPSLPRLDIKQREIFEYYGYDFGKVR